jgi:hypothetical protein
MNPSQRPVLLTASYRVLDPPSKVPDSRQNAVQLLLACRLNDVFCDRG